MSIVPSRQEGRTKERTRVKNVLVALFRLEDRVIINIKPQFATVLAVLQEGCNDAFLSRILD